MDGSTPNPNEPAPRQPSPLRDLARALASEGRRFYYGLTRENVTSFLKTLAWAAPLTILIWVYAESEEQVADAGQPINIEVTSGDPNKIVTLNPGESVVICDLQGPRSNIDRFKESLSTSLPITIELDTRQKSNQSDWISTLDYLRENPRFKEAGITIEKCSPPILPIYVDTREKRLLPVGLPPNVPVQDVTFTPATVTVTGPSRALKGVSEVIADISALPVLNQPGVHPVDNVSLVPDPSGSLKYEPSQVKAILTVAEKSKSTNIGVPIWLETTLDVRKQFDITPSGNGFVPKLEVIGPPEQIAKLEAGDVAPIPHAVLEITMDNVHDTTPVPLKIEDLPDGVHLAGPPPTITFTATPRQ